MLAWNRNPEIPFLHGSTMPGAVSKLQSMGVSKKDQPLTRNSLMQTNDQLWVHCYPNVGHRYLVAERISHRILESSESKCERSRMIRHCYENLEQKFTKKMAVLAVTSVLVRQCLDFWWLFTSLQDLLSALTNSKLPHTDCSAPHKGRANTRALRRLDLRGQSQGLVATRCINHVCRKAPRPHHKVQSSKRNMAKSSSVIASRQEKPFWNEPNLNPKCAEQKWTKGVSLALILPRDYLWLVFCLLPRLHVFAPVANSAVYCPFKRKVL